MDITQATERQFKRILEKQGKTVYDVENDCERKVMFMRQSAKNSQEKIRIAYPQDYPWAKGTIIKYHDMYFLITSREAFESDVYHISVAIKCNDEWHINGRNYYVVAGDLGSPSPKNGTVTSTVGGTLSIYTSDNASIMIINDRIYDFGGTYTCINTFNIDGIKYYYFERTPDNTSADWTLTCRNQEVTYNLADTKGASFRCEYYSKVNNYNTYDPHAIIEYYSSDESIASIDQNGYVTFHKTGNVQIMCLAKGGYWKEIACFTRDLLLMDSSSVYATITGLMDQDDDNIPFETEMPYSHKEYTLTAHYFVGEEEDLTKTVATWEIHASSGGQYSLDGENKIYNYAYSPGGTEYKGCAQFIFSGNTVHVIPDINGTTSAKAFYYDPLIFYAIFEDGTSARLVVEPR